MLCSIFYLCKTKIYTSFIVYFRFLRVIDRFNNLLVSAYVTPGGAYLLLLHDGKNEDAVRSFMIEVHEIYVKHLLNPFVTPDSPICSAAFDSHVRAASRRILSL